MSRRKKAKWNYDVYDRMLRKGRGQGHLSEYKPWITVYDFPSKGKVARICGKKTNRIHHLLSSLETMAFTLFDNDIHVTDIREQYPLDLGETLRIAYHLGIPHPRINDCWYTMTTDFLVDMDSGQQIARAVKPKSELDNPRVREKLQIEEAYWKKHHVEWAVLTEENLNRTHVSNLQWLNYGEPLERLIPGSQDRKVTMDTFLDLYNMHEIPFMTLLSEFEELGGYPPGTSIQIFKALILENRIDIDLTQPIHRIEPRKRKLSCSYF
jgi:hypothetical protein